MNTVTETMSFRCDRCRKLWSSKINALDCLYLHIRYDAANESLKQERTLGCINMEYGFMWALDENQRWITKDNCFTIPYLQCCERPAYQITEITEKGGMIVGGVGSWTGGYSSLVGLSCLTDPRPLDELYIDKRVR